MEGVFYLGKKKEMKKLQDQALANLYMVGLEHKQLVRKTSQERGSFDWEELLSDYELEGLYKVRKDRRYASLTVELYAIIEQLLKDIYSVIYDAVYVQTPDVNVILDLEKKLNDYLKFDNNTKLLADLRSFIIHEDFSLKKARKSENINITSNNKNLFKRLLKDAEGYIKNIEFK